MYVVKKLKRRKGTRAVEDSLQVALVQHRRQVRLGIKAFRCSRVLCLGFQNQV